MPGHTKMAFRSKRQTAHRARTRRRSHVTPWAGKHVPALGQTGQAQKVPGLLKDEQMGLDEAANSGYNREGSALLSNSTTDEGIT